MRHLVFLSFLIFAISCSNTSNSQETTVQTNENGSSVTSGKYGPVLFKSKMAASDDYNLVDVRTPEELVENGRIVGAVNINYYDGDFAEKMDDLDKSIPTFIYCRSGGRSGEATADILKLGFVEVYDLEGGYNAWLTTDFK